MRGVTPLRTNNTVFYRVDTNLTVPRVNADRWELRIDGMVERPMTITYQQLMAMPMIERDITLTCVSNEGGGGYVSATKWLSKLTASTYAKDEACWTKRDWATDAPIKMSSRIDTPRPLSMITAGMTAIGGVAWAQHIGIAAVEVSIDDGPWQKTKLGPAVSID